jgi:hypothetical protein
MSHEDEAKQYADFVTVTCLEWRHILKDDRCKNIVVDSLSYLSGAKRADILLS